MNNTLKFNLRPIGRDIDRAGEKGSCFLRSHGFSDDAVQVQTNILTGLIKNSIKYANFRPSANEIAVSLQIDKRTCTIEVKNPVDETCSDRLRELDNTIRFIRGYQDPYEAYSIKRAEVAAQASIIDANDLGLVKIACEGGAVIDFYVSEDNFLNLSAVGSIDGGLSV
jgi:hypothetical protein